MHHFGLIKALREIVYVFTESFVAPGSSFSPFLTFVYLIQFLTSFSYIFLVAFFSFLN